jgi:protein SCO1/2
VNRFRAFAVLAIAAVALGGCGGSSGAGTGSDDAVVEQPTDNPYRGGQVLPLQPAPEIGLKTVDGDVVKMADLRGKVVLVTFVYSHCPDVCILIVESMKAARLKLGKQHARDVALVAVSVDPEGDTPTAVKEFLVRHNVRDSLRYVVGTRAQLEPIWKNWAVAVQEDFKHPELVEHSGVVWIVDPKGNRAVYYPVSSVKANDLVHDIKLLLDAK